MPIWLGVVPAHSSHSMSGFPNGGGQDSEMGRPHAENPNDSDDDQIERDDVVQETRRHEDENTGDQGNDWAQTECDVHENSEW